MYTDLPEREAVLAVTDLERSWRRLWDLTDLFFPRRPPPDGDWAVAIQFADPRHLEAITGDERHLGAFLPRGVRWLPTLLLTGSLDDETRRVYQHELTHRFVTYHAPHAPAWLQEGVARYYESLRVDSGTAVLGEQPPSVRIDRVGGGRTGLLAYELPSVADLLAADYERFHDDSRKELRLEHREMGYYTGAWGLLHLLANGPEQYRPLLLVYINALCNGAPSRNAWQGAFARVPPDVLEKDYRAHFVRTETRVYQTPYPPQQKVPMDVEPAAAAETESVLSELRRYFAREEPAPPRADRPRTGRLQQLDRADIVSGMKAVLPQVLECATRHGQTGAAIVRMIIAPDGAPSEVFVAGPLAGTPAGECVVGAVKQARFPPFSGSPIRLQYPYMLR